MVICISLEKEVVACDRSTNGWVLLEKEMHAMLRKDVELLERR